jgi:glutathione S-transferase
MKNQEASSLTLYHTEYCPYCARVRDAVEALGLDLPMKDTSVDRAARSELVAGGGKPQVPCLRIDEPGGQTRWMYESAAIIRYLQDVARERRGR